MKYRPDIDGLRAVAVLPVLFYHAGVPGFPGGFVGVDIFFVISGYLICGMINADICNGTFSLGSFYKRRALRILPALFAMFIVTSVMAYVYCLPVELKDYAKSLASAAGSVSNIYFATVADYFDAPAETKPLLHTWSLGVEEQFYLVAPLLMLFAYRILSKRTGLLIAVLAGSSFAAAFVMSYRNPTFVFYLAPFRAWELAIGALLSMHLIPLPRTALLANAIGAAGLLLLLGTIICGSSAVPLLLMTSLASVGAVLVIASSERKTSVVGRLLSLKPLVFVGLISYSLYLWHWPLIVFQRSDSVLSTSSPASTKMTLIVLSIGFAYLSWKLIEQPFRAMGRRTSKAVVFAGTSAAMASAFALCGLIVFAGGAPFRFPGRVVAIAAYLGYDATTQFRTGQCFLATNRQHLDLETCVKLDPQRPNYLLVGDSHAAHIWFGLSQAMPDVNVMQATASMCRSEIASVSVLDSRACPKLLRFVFDDFLAHNKIDKVLLAASWKDEDLAGLSRTLQTLKEKGVAASVLGPIVEYDRALPRLLVDEIQRDDDSIAGRMRTQGVRERDREMKRLVEAAGAIYLSVYDAVCPNGRCEEFAGADVPMQFDAGHLTPEGSVKVGRRLSTGLASKLARVNDVSK